ncbi:MAG: hypothetical protein RI973_2199, partial [Bacteroidota bacterium]
MKIQITRRSIHSKPARESYLSTSLTLAALLIILLLPWQLLSQTEPSALMELQSTDKGFLLPRMTQAQRDAIAGPAMGLMIYNTTTGCLETNHGSPALPLWQAVNCFGHIDALDCGVSNLTGTLSVGQPTAGVIVSVQYTGGNGGSHNGQEVTSTGVAGLTATLPAGRFAKGNGILIYEVTGTPAAGGTASFALAAGGQACTLAVTVPGIISGLDCGGAVITGSLASGQPAAGVSASVPYAGGNGGTHPGQVVSSTGVAGLTATLPAGTFVNGAGSLDYIITGTPATHGLASFALNIGGQACTLSVTVGAGISSLGCAGAVVTGSLTAGQGASGVSASVPYTGGSGGPHNGQVVSSTGVVGLTATLAAGSFSNGSGNLVYAITGTPAAGGTANFALSIGGQACTLAVTVPGIISGLDCGGAVITGSLASGQPAAGVSATVPYTGGSGGPHDGQVVSSTGVVGLTATLTPGSFANGSGSLEYAIAGTPVAGGTANFALNIGGQACTLSVIVGCGAYVAPNQWKEFMCHNLAAANTAAGPFTPSWEIIGGYWQWGRKGPDASQWLNTNTPNFAHGPTGPGAGETNEAAVSGWSTSGAPNGAWSDAAKTANDPCPTGFRVPTKAQWEGVLANNTLSDIGTWSYNATNYSSGKSIGPNLFLPAAGFRVNSNGTLSSRGTEGWYWSTTENGSDGAWDLYFSSGNASMFIDDRSYGLPLRCIADDFSGSIGTLHCGGAVLSNILFSGQPAAGVLAKVPYTGGNGGTHPGQTVTSTGVS